jgi:hypothetical protein
LNLIEKRGLADETGCALREIIDGEKITMGVAAHDPLLARLVQNAGFKMVSVSGNAVAASYLGRGDRLAIIGAALLLFLASPWLNMLGLALGVAHVVFRQKRRVEPALQG